MSGLNLVKVAVGVRDIKHLQMAQAMRSQGGPIQHRTRNQPKRRDELLDGGSLYWIIKGVLLVRQPILDIQEGVYEDGSKCAVITLQKDLINLQARSARGHQGWRYLEKKDAPPDQNNDGGTSGIEDLPPKLRKELEILGLI